jgi:uncharacterized protein
MFRPNKIASCLLLLFLISGNLFATKKGSKAQQKLLVVSVTKKFRHKSIPTLEKTLQQMSERFGSYALDYARTDEDINSKMTPEALKQYTGVIFASTTGDLPLPDRKAFLDWIKAGNAFIGIHSATDTFHEYPEFIEMIGGEFLSHGKQSTVRLLNEDKDHPSNRPFGRAHTVYEEIYQFKSYNRDNVHMLLSLDRHPNKDESGYFPIAWCKNYGKGRMFYTALGHREDVIQSEWFQQHLNGGIEWATGQAKGDAHPQTAKKK